MMTVTRQRIYLAGFGLVLGYCLERIGFASFNEVHRLFVFADFRLLFTFMGAVAITMAGCLLFARGRTLTLRPYHKGSIAGGILFGAGWAITGTCPTAALIYVGIGHVPALATVAGIVAGMFVYHRLKPRFFRWSTGGCE